MNKSPPVQAAGYQLFTEQRDLTDEQCCYTKGIQNKVESKAVAGWFASQ